MKTDLPADRQRTHRRQTTPDTPELSCVLETGLASAAFEILHTASYQMFAIDKLRASNWEPTSEV